MTEDQLKELNHLKHQIDSVRYELRVWRDHLTQPSRVIAENREQYGSNYTVKGYLNDEVFEQIRQLAISDLQKSLEILQAEFAQY